MAVAERIEEAVDTDLVEARFERIGGFEYAMSSPGYKHQIAVGRLFSQLDSQLSKHGCMPIVAPFDVYPLYDQGDEDTFVQPDIFTVCDKSKLQENRYNGAPQFIIEILSGNRAYYILTKFNLYKKANIAEYWMVDIVNPNETIISVLHLSGGSYIYRNYDGTAEVPLATIPGCAVDFNKVFLE
jgi:Uma2 family endonuclease